MLKKQTLGPKGIHCEECILKETSFPSCLTPLGIQFPFSLAGVPSNFTKLPTVVLDSRCKVIVVIASSPKSDKSRETHLFYVKVSHQVWLVRAWNSSTLYTSGPTNCSEQPDLHKLISLAHQALSTNYISLPSRCR